MKAQVLNRIVFIVHVCRTLSQNIHILMLNFSIELFNVSLSKQSLFLILIYNVDWWSYWYRFVHIQYYAFLPFYFYWSRSLSHNSRKTWKREPAECCTCKAFTLPEIKLKNNKKANAKRVTKKWILFTEIFRDGIYPVIVISNHSIDLFVLQMIL